MNSIIDKTVEVAEIELTFGGQSLWSKAEPQQIKVKLYGDYTIDIENAYENLSLEAYFDIEDWDVREKGLIYTDLEFEKQLNEFLLQEGFPTVSYSEQGMQGNRYVHFDWRISDKFIEIMNRTEI